MKKILIDQRLYSISQSDYERIMIAEGDCCGSCNKETLQNLRNVLLDIITKYSDIELHVTHIPSDQYAIKNKITYDDNLPF